MTNKVNTVITERFLESLDKGIVPWQQPWVDREGFKNAISKKAYRGVNTVMLSMLGADEYFMTFNQGSKLGGKLKKGSKGIPITFYKMMDGERRKENGEKEKFRFPFLRYYTVFNASDWEDLNWKRPVAEGVIEFIPVEAAEALIKTYREVKDKPAIIYGGNDAFYRPSTGEIRMPHKETFKSVAFFYKTLFHEIGHSLGHKVGDEVENRFGDEKYSKEELAAEMFAAFMLNYTGLMEDGLFDNSTAYIQNWRKALDKDHGLIISAASRAQKRFDLLVKPETVEPEAVG